MTDFDWASYTKEVLRTCGPNEDKTRLTMAALGLAGETGELVDYIKKMVFHDKPYDKDSFVKEAGDVLWYFAVLLHSLNIDIQEVMTKNIEKLRKRYPDGFSPEASAARVDARPEDDCTKPEPLAHLTSEKITKGFW